MAGSGVADRLMCDDQDDTLVEYYFGDLSPEDAARLEQRLKDDPELAGRFVRLRECLEQAGEPTKEAPPADQPPSDLADRTCHKILARRAGEAAQCVGRKRFSLLEVGAVSIAALLLGSLTMPAIHAARDRSRRIICEKNLLEIYQGLQRYSGEHGSRFPEIGLGQNAGLFTVALAEGEYLDRKQLRTTLVCPSSPLAEAIADRRVAVIVPSLADLLVAPPLVRDRLEHLMAGSFAYRIGYFSGNTYRNHKNRSNCRAALMADSPTRCEKSGTTASSHHGTCGQNVLFEDGHVAFQSCWSPGCGDHLFLNDAEEVAAGCGPGDIVLAPSAVTPGVIRLVPFRF